MNSQPITTHSNRIRFPRELVSSSKRLSLFLRLNNKNTIPDTIFSYIFLVIKIPSKMYSSLDAFALAFVALLCFLSQIEARLVAPPPTPTLAPSADSFQNSLRYLDEYEYSIFDEWWFWPVVVCWMIIWTMIVVCALRRAFMASKITAGNTGDTSTTNDHGDANVGSSGMASNVGERQNAQTFGFSSIFGNTIGGGTSSSTNDNGGGFTSSSNDYGGGGGFTSSSNDYGGGGCTSSSNDYGGGGCTSSGNGGGCDFASSY